jgi:hypothetical protein
LVLRPGEVLQAIGVDDRADGFGAAMALEPLLRVAGVPSATLLGGPTARLYVTPAIRTIRALGGRAWSHRSRLIA